MVVVVDHCSLLSHTTNSQSIEMLLPMWPPTHLACACMHLSVSLLVLSFSLLVLSRVSCVQYSFDQASDLFINLLWAQLFEKKVSFVAGASSKESFYQGDLPEVAFVGMCWTLTLVC